MKRINFLISQKEKKSNLKLEDKEIFYLFARIIKSEYGNQGTKNLKATYFKNGKIFIKSDSSVFSNELLLNKNEIIRKINQELGEEAVKEIKMK